MVNEENILLVGIESNGGNRSVGNQRKIQIYRLNIFIFEKNHRITFNADRNRK